MIIMLLGTGLLFGGIFGYKAWLDVFLNDLFDNMPPPTAVITQSEVRVDRWQPKLEAVGSLSAVQGMDLSTEVSGIISEILFTSGSPVEAGQVLLRLDTATEEAQLERLQAASRLADLDWERARRLAREGNLSEAELQRQESVARQARAAVIEQQARIRQKTLVAPFSGELGIRRVSLGEYLAAGDPVVSLQSIDPVNVDFFLAERHVSQVRRGQALDVHVDALGRSFTGELIAIEPALQSSSRSLLLQASLENPDGILRPGMFARIGLDMGEAADVLLIPQSAVRFQPFGAIVFVVDEDADGKLTVSQRLVQIGARRGDMVVVEQGLEAGDRVATSGLLKLRNGTVVEINDDPALQPGEETEPSLPNT